MADVKPTMSLSVIDNSLLLAAFFRGGTRDQDRWISCSDQVVTLSLFYTGDITTVGCRFRSSTRGHVGCLYDDDGELNPQIKSRYQHLVNLLHGMPRLIEAGGDFDTPADPTFTACRLTDDGIRLMPRIIDQFPRKPDFLNWPDRRTYLNPG